MEKPSGGASKLEQDALIEHLVPDASQVPDVQVLAGFLGKSTRAAYWRLYLTVTLNEYVEFAEEDVVHSHAFESDESRLGGTVVWVRRGANLQHTRSASREAQADFLQGAITASALGRPGTSGRARRGFAVPPQLSSFVPGHCLPSFGGVHISCVSDICNLAPAFTLPQWFPGCPDVQATWHAEC